MGDPRLSSQLYELEATERREIEGELLQALEAKGYEIICHDSAKTQRCFSCTISRVVDDLPKAPDSSGRVAHECERAPGGSTGGERCLRACKPDGEIGVLDDYIFGGPGSMVTWGRGREERPYIAERYDAEEDVWVLRDETPAEVAARVAEIERKGNHG